MEDEFCKLLSKYDDDLPEEFKINCVLFNVMHDEKYFDIELIEKIMLKLYDEKQVQFFIKVLESKFLVQEEKIIKEYSSKKYDSNMFCRKGPKDFWWTEAKILKNKDYTDIKNSINDLFEWLQDFNWPGVSDIIDLLLNIPKDDFVKEMEYSVKKAFDFSIKDYVK